MFKIIIILLIIVFPVANLTAQEQGSQYSISAQAGTGFPMGEPSATPLSILLSAHYHLSSHWAIGGGTGYAWYDKVSLIPLFVNGKFTIKPNARFNPFAACSIGYSFAPESNCNVGFYLNPAIGVQHRLWGKLFSIAIGYELQQLERQKKYSNDYFESEFVEKLRFPAIGIKLGIAF